MTTRPRTARPSGARPPRRRRPGSTWPGAAGPDGRRGPGAAAAGAGRSVVRVLFTVHHLLTDGVSWRVLLDDLATAHAQVRAGQDVDLGPKTSSERQWARRLAEHTATGGFDAQLPYWREVTERADTGPLPLDDPEGDATVGAQETVSVALDAEETRALLTEVPPVHATRVDDVLLTALARTLRGWTGRDRLAVHLEGHGREELFAELDLTRTVGWFTSIYPVALALPEGEGWGPAVTAVKEQLRAVPDRGIGYGALRHLGNALPDRPEPRISFNYLGRLDGLGERALYRAARMNPGGEFGPAEARPHELDVIGEVRDGQLVLTWSYSGRGCGGTPSSGWPTPWPVSCGTSCATAPSPARAAVPRPTSRWLA
ncbi:condensation domain-containing protein [Actinomadura keratinilytica]